MDKAQEKIARWYYYKISAVHISKEEIVAWERLNESAREFYRKEADQILALIPELPDKPPLLSDDDEIMAKLWGKAQTETENPMCEYDATECVMILVALAQWDIWNEWFIKHYGGGR